MAAWLVEYRETMQPLCADDLAFNESHGRVMERLRRVVGALGLESLALTSHSFRRGAASEMAAGCELSAIIETARWAHEESCKEYFRKGELFILRHLASCDPALRGRMGA